LGVHAVRITWKGEIMSATVVGKVQLSPGEMRRWRKEKKAPEKHIKSEPMVFGCFTSRAGKAQKVSK
jgi:hypothetical protein